jgi:molybdenum cofactor guanylyltransferase
MRSSFDSVASHLTRFGWEKKSQTTRHNSRPKQEQHPGAVARGAVRHCCGMVFDDPWARLRMEGTQARPPCRDLLSRDYSAGSLYWLVADSSAFREETMTTTISRAPLSAAVLAGGQSSRMGTDKAFLPLIEGGEPMLGTVIGHLHHVAQEVIVIANDRERYERFGTRVVPDLIPGGGALAGIHAGVHHARYDHCLIVACDMPFLNVALLQWMASQPRDFDVLIPLIPGESRQSRNGFVFQTLHAIYGKQCLPAIEARAADGNRQVIGFFESVRVRPISLEAILLHDPERNSFFNANTPEALALAAQIFSDREPETGDRRFK